MTPEQYAAARAAILAMTPEDVERMFAAACPWRTGDLSPNVRLEQPRQWVPVNGVKHRSPSGETRIGIGIGEWVEGPDWFTISQVEGLIGELQNAVATARQWNTQIGELGA